MGTLAVAVEANLSGTVWTDLSQDVLQAPGLTLDWGMDGGRPDDNCARPGTCALTLTQAARLGGLQGRYSPGHANALAGFDLNTPLRVILQDGPNRCVNSGFELNTAAEWTKYDGAAEVTSYGQSAATFHSGAKCYQVTWTGGADAKGIRPVAGVGNLPWSPYTTYVVSCWAKLATATPAMNLGWVGTAPASSVAIGAVNLSTVWQRFAWLITWGATVNATVGDFIFWVNNTGTHTIYFDDMQVERAAGLSDWHDSGHRICGPYRITDLTPTPGQYREQQVSVLAADWLEEAAEAPVYEALAINVTAPWLMTSLLSAMAVQPTATSFDDGVGIFEYPLRGMTGRNNRLLAAFKDVAQSDGALVYLTSGGTLRFESRSTRAGNTTDAFTLTDTMHGITAQRSRDALINVFNLTVHPPILSTTQVTLCEITEPFLLLAGQTMQLTLDYRDPDTGEACGGFASGTATPPDWFYGDWTANSLADGTGTDYTGHASLQVGYPSGGYPGSSKVTFQVISALSVDVYITYLRQRGLSIVDRDPVVVISKNATSITTYGRKTLDIDLPYQSASNFAQGLSDYWRSLYSDAAMRASSVSIVAVMEATHLAMLLAVDIGTRLKLTETMTGIGESYWVQGVTIAIRQGPVAEMALRLAPASDTLFFMLDSSLLDNTTRMLGY